MMLDATAGRGTLIAGDWRERLATIIDMMRAISRETDPQAMVRAYRERLQKIMPRDGFVALSRRDLEPPRYRITRASLWGEEVDPWHDRDRLPVLEGGLLGELIYGDEPRIIDELHVADDDPAAEYFRGMRSLMAIPNYDGGVALNMTVLLSREPAGFEREQFPEQVWMSNLFGRATHSLVLSAELKEAYRAVERELRVVAEIQRALLPRVLPRIPGLDLAAHYQTSRWAGGDYYDFFPLPGDLWGLLIADVSGHGTPAAVVMAITHSIAHAYSGEPTPPGRLLSFVNDRLAARYTADNETFVTAFYGIYDPARRTLSYASAGHNPPRLIRCVDGSVAALEGARHLPLGVLEGEQYGECSVALVPGDQIILYTDGITEATDPSGRMYGVDRFDAILRSCPKTASDLIAVILEDLDRFTAGQPAADDRTLLVGKIS